MGMKLYDEQAVQNIANAVRNKRVGYTDKMKIGNMAEQINKIRLGCPITVSMHINDRGEWVRPSEWCDLDSLGDIPDNTIYMTFDNTTERIDNPFLSFDIGTSESKYTISIGTVSNGAYTADTIIDVSGSTYQAWLGDLTTRSYPVIRVTTSTGYIKSLSFNNSAKDSDGRYYQANKHSMLERYGKCTYCTWVTNSGMHLERDKLIEFAKNGVVKEGIYSIWQGCYSLQNLDLSGWDTTNWAVTNMSYTWYGCYSLQNLDLSGWDTTNWAVTTMSNTWYGCYSLQNLDLSGWDTTNWAVTTMSNTWYCCYSLQNLDLSGWDTTNWETTINAPIRNNKCLKKVDLSGFTTKVTNDYFSRTSTWNNLFSGCQQLASITLGTWNTFSLYLKECNLDHDALLSIINELATVTTTTYLIIGNGYYRLSEAERKIATDKGWTVTT